MAAVVADQPSAPEAGAASATEPDHSHAFGAKSISWWGSFVLNLNNVMGPACVLLPLVNHQAGWLTPMLGLFIIFVQSSFACTMVRRLQAPSRHASNGRDPGPRPARRAGPGRSCASAAGGWRLMPCACVCCGEPPRHHQTATPRGQTAIGCPRSRPAPAAQRPRERAGRVRGAKGRHGVSCLPWHLTRSARVALPAAHCRRFRFPLCRDAPLVPQPPTTVPYPNRRSVCSVASAC